MNLDVTEVRDWFANFLGSVASKVNKAFPMADDDCDDAESGAETEPAEANPAPPSGSISALRAISAPPAPRGVTFPHSLQKPRANAAAVAVAQALAADETAGGGAALSIHELLASQEPTLPPESICAAEVLAPIQNPMPAKTSQSFLVSQMVPEKPRAIAPAQTAGPKLSPKWLINGSSGERYSLDFSSIFIGREPMNDICLLGEESVEKVHAMITCDSGVCWLINKCGAEKTRLNNQSVRDKARLGVGDEIAIGSVILKAE